MTTRPGSGDFPHRNTSAAAACRSDGQAAWFVCGLAVEMPEWHTRATSPLLREKQAILSLPKDACRIPGNGQVSLCRQLSFLAGHRHCWRESTQRGLVQLVSFGADLSSGQILFRDSFACLFLDAPGLGCLTQAFSGSDEQGFL